MTRLFRSLALSLLLLPALALPARAAADSPVFVGSKSVKKYHRETCRWAQKISAKNKVTFKSADEAVVAGYVAFKVCKPPTGSK